ncbi:MAG: helix-turn-helix transcriptional regulator [Clostridium sp.]|nr:helix-turn-helix transcriptional regulator [Clostridium sp.]
MLDKSLLGKRIKELRKCKGMTQELLAEKVGIDSKHLSRVECGKNAPSFELLNRISAALQIELSLLFDTLHLKTKKELINEIDNILERESEENIKTFYKIIVHLIM